MRRFFLHPVALALLMGAAPAVAAAQPQNDAPAKPSDQDSGQTPDKSSDQKNQKQSESKSQDKQPDDSSSSSSSSSASGDAKELQQADQQQKYDPLPAEKDVDVGMFYMHKGDLDAAIGRFQDAIERKADYAKPRLLLAQTYEKKHDNVNAVKYYKEYLEVFPHAPDAKKVQEKIEKLSGR